METATLELSLDAELVRAYHAASPEEREKLDLLLSVLMRQMVRPQKQTLLEIMDAMSDEAQANGLTEEILQDILSEDDPK